jgi:hypothetical protein
VRAVTQASLSVCSGVPFGAAVETGLFSGLHGLRCLHPWQLHPHPALGRTRGVRGRVLPCVGPVLEHGRRSKQKGRRKKRQPTDISFHFLLNLSRIARARLADFISLGRLKTKLRVVQAQFPAVVEHRNVKFDASKVLKIGGF